MNLLHQPQVAALPNSVVSSCFSEQGVRPTNEDCAVVVRSCNSATLILCDGHGGQEASQYMASYLEQHIPCNAQEICIAGSQMLGDLIVEGEARMQQAHQHTWSCLPRDPGTTVLAATIIETKLHVANTGDCRLLLISESVNSEGARTAVVSHTTADHNARTSLSERQRVEAAGGHLGEEGYVCSVLEVSRSVGGLQDQG